MKTREVAIFVSFVACVATAGTASAYTPKWLQCDGQLVVSGAGAGTQPAHDYYVYDDDNKNLFVYQPARHTEAIEPVKVYNDSEIRWSMDGHGINNARWDGRIDRKNLSLRLDYAETGSTRTWTEQCKPSNPPADAVSASNDAPKPAPANVGPTPKPGQ